MTTSTSSDPAGSGAAAVGDRPIGVRRVRGKAGAVLPDGVVIVDRTSRRGNPFTADDIVKEYGAAGVELARAEAEAIACRRYAAWLDGAGEARRQLPGGGRQWVDRNWIQAYMPDLVGRSLACPCRLGVPCHREVLLARAELLARRDPAAVAAVVAARRAMAVDDHALHDDLSAIAAAYGD